MQRSAIERLLPAAYQRAAVDGTVLAAVLDVMEALHAPDEALLGAVEEVFDPYRAPEPFVAFLAAWVDLDGVLTPAGPSGAFAAGTGQLRNLLAEAATLAQWRGTAAGLRWFLETATGHRGFTVAGPAGRPFHVEVTVPAAAAGYQGLVRRIVEREKPAYTTCTITVDDAPVEDAAAGDGPGSIEPGGATASGGSDSPRTEA
ncbi:MAG: phage tail protein [Acidimicrobiia bacterium]